MKPRNTLLQLRARLSGPLVRLAHWLHFHAAMSEAERIEAEWRKRRKTNRITRQRRKASAYFPGGQP